MTFIEKIYIFALCLIITSMANVSVNTDDYPITIKIAMDLLKCSQGTASNRINQVRDALDRPHPKVITIAMFRQYYFD